VNPNSDKSAEVRSEYPIYNSRFVVPQRLCEPRQACDERKGRHGSGPIN
jgi:hypothetical protein